MVSTTTPVALVVMAAVAASTMAAMVAPKPPFALSRHS
jgi:hypothetical protein